MCVVCFRNEERTAAKTDFFKAISWLIYVEKGKTTHHNMLFVLLMMAFYGFLLLFFFEQSLRAVQIFKKKSFSLSLSLCCFCNRDTLYYARARLYVHIFCDG